MLLLTRPRIAVSGMPMRRVGVVVAVALLMCDVGWHRGTAGWS